jgi:hypothetical protein
MDGEDALVRIVDRSPEPEHALTQMDRTAELLAAQQQALVLRFRQELPNKEIGRIMHRSEGAVKALPPITGAALRPSSGSVCRRRVHDLHGAKSAPHHDCPPRNCRSWMPNQPSKEP